MSAKFLPIVLAAQMVQAADPPRPKVLGVAHAAFFVSDLAKARAFYKDFLGYGEPYALKGPDGVTDRIAFIKINEEQYVELFADPPKQDGRLNHLAFATDDARAMRDYLNSRGVHVPEKVGVGKIGNLNFTVSDPEGHTVEFVQYMPDSRTRRETGKYLPATRVSSVMYHAGATIGPLDRAMKFYAGILGFQEFWRGSSNGEVLSWVNMRVPDGDTYLEMMLYGGDRPPAARLGTMNHICLVVPDIEKAVAMLEARPARKSYERTIEIHTGINRKRQANLYDPDGTRVELMEPNTIDGKPTPPSTARPPQ